MLASVLAQAQGFDAPHIDWHALAPEVILVATIVVALLIDVFTEDYNKGLVSSVVGLGILASFVPLITLGLDDHARSMFGGAYVVDDFALVLKGVFLVAGYLTVLLSTNAIAEGDYHEGEYYLLLLSSVLGMTIMASSRDLISIFVALEMLSIPAYLLASWRKRTQTGIEAGMKYYLMGVFATAVMLYGMSLIFGGTGTTLLSGIGEAIDGSFGRQPVAVLGIVFVIVGFAFKISAVPFHNWAPDTYEGAPTPVTAFLSVASKTAGFVAILQLVFIGFLGRTDTIRPFMFVLAVLTMTVGNVIALRQTNVVRLFAYSSVAQAGFILAPLAVISQNQPARLDKILSSIVLYLIVYTVMNLGAFAVIIAVSRRTQSGEISSWSGLFTYAPGLAVAMGAFLFGLGGIPPAAGWFAKFRLFDAVVGSGSPSAYAMGVVMAVNSVISLAYYLGLMRTMFMDDPVDGDVTPVKVPVPLRAAVIITGVATIVLGALPGLVANVAKGATFLTALPK
ncbi:NADH-quinone oxidoreductase subunit N [soil metagenome]